MPPAPSFFEIWMRPSRTPAGSSAPGGTTVGDAVAVLSSAATGSDPTAPAYPNLASLPPSLTFDVDVRARSQLDGSSFIAVLRRGARGRVELSRRRRAGDRGSADRAAHQRRAGRGAGVHREARGCCRGR